MSIAQSGLTKLGDPRAPTQRKLLARLERRVGQLLVAHPGSVLAQIGRTPLLPLPAPAPDIALWAKLEGDNPSGSLKDRIVLYLIAEALERGRLGPGVTLIEGTSGNTGIALAMICAALGYPVKIFMPANVSEERRRLIAAYGASVELTPAERGTDGAVEAARALSRDPAYCWLAQHENPVNPWAHYLTTGAEILQQCPQLSYFIAPSGTTGTLMGVSRRLKESKPEVQVIAVWPEEWIMGLRRPEGEKRPAIYDQRLIDRVMEISDAQAKAGARELARSQGLLVGPSSGAAWRAALKLAEELPASGDKPVNIVICFPDEGARYLSTDTFG